MTNTHSAACPALVPRSATIPAGQRKETGHYLVLVLLAIAAYASTVIPAQAQQIYGSAGLTNASGATLTVSSHNASNSYNFQNNGTLDITTSGTLTNWGPGKLTNNSGGVLDNYGTLNGSYVTAQGIGTLNNSGALYNYGILNTSSGGFDPMFGGTTLNNSGTLSNNVGGTLNVCYQDTLGNHGALTNSGIVNISDSSELDNYGTMSNSGTLNADGGLYNDSGRTLTNSGTLGIYRGGSLLNRGTLNNNSGGSLIVGNLSSTLINGGTINNDGTITITNAAQMTTEGNFTNSGAVTVQSGGMLFNSGGPNYTQMAGSTLVDGTLAMNGGSVKIQGGTLSGSGTVNGMVDMSGTMIAGTAGNPGNFTIVGYEQTATGIYDEQISSTGNGLLKVNSLATLDSGATLKIDLLNGFDPLNGMSFIIMDYGSETGVFTLADPLFNNGLQQWIVTYGAGAGNNEIVLTAESTAAVTTPEPCSLFLVGSVVLLSLGRYAKKRAASPTR